MAVFLGDLGAMSAASERNGIFHRVLRLIGLALRDDAGRVPANGCPVVIGKTKPVRAARNVAPGTDTQAAIGEAIANANRFMLPARIASVGALNPPKSRARRARSSTAAKKVVKRHVRLVKYAA